MKIFSEKKTHMHREFEKQSTHHPEHNRNPMHLDGDIEMVTKGKTSSMAEKHLQKVLGENDILKEKLEKQKIQLFMLIFQHLKVKHPMFG